MTRKMSPIIIRRYGNLLIGIDATKVQVEETEHNLSVKVDYALEVNYEHMADCKITMNIQSKNGRGFQNLKYPAF